MMYSLVHDFGEAGEHGWERCRNPDCWVVRRPDTIMGDIWPQFGVVDPSGTFIALNAGDSFETPCPTWATRVLELRKASG